MGTRNERILLVGPPRSGTTIVANYINSMHRAICFVEPHWEVGFYGSSQAFDDPRLRWIFRLKYRSTTAMPMDDAVRRLGRRFDTVAIKETFRGDHYAKHDPRLPNEGLLARYVEAGYRLMSVWRNPFDVWNSFLSFFPPSETWASDLDAFIENYRRFDAFADGSDPLTYERFVEDPSGEAARAGLGSKVPGGRLMVRASRMGDTTARNSEQVSAIQKPCRIPRHQHAEIERSGIVGLYNAAREVGVHGGRTAGSTQ